MIILGIDTCLSACSCALIADEKLLARASEPMTRGHQERLAPMVRDVMASADMAFDQLDRVGVTVGPGSFTGLRVGLAFAKGLGLALGRAPVGVSTLEALAASAARDGMIVAAIDAGRGNLYLQIFTGARPVMAPDIVTMAQAAARLIEICGDQSTTLVGPGAGLLAPMAPGAALLNLMTPEPEAVARLAEAAEVAPPYPLYLRAPDALPKAERRA